jgi:hypothetical protein
MRSIGTNRAHRSNFGVRITWRDSISKRIDSFTVAGAHRKVQSTKSMRVIAIVLELDRLVGHAEKERLDLKRCELVS